MGKIGIHVQNAWIPKNIIVANNYVEKCGDAGTTIDGIVLQEADNSIVTGNLVNNCMGCGIRLAGSAVHSTINGIISNNICWNNGQGLSANDIFRSGIATNASGASLSNIMIVDNRCYDNQGTQTQKYGIRVANGIDCIVKNNDLRGNLTAGYIASSSTNTKVFGNEGYLTENYGATSVAEAGTVSHGLATTPTVVLAQSRIPGEMAYVTARAATTFTVSYKKHDNTAGTTPQTIDWRAYV